MLYEVIGYFKNGGQNYKPGDTVSGLDPVTEKELLDLERIKAPEGAAPAAPAEPQAPAAPADPAPVDPPAQPPADSVQPVVAPIEPQAPAGPSADEIANDPQLQ